jgi:hypothetical protein
MKIKFTVIGLGVCVATSLDEKIIYCILGVNEIYWNDASFKGNSNEQNLVDFILEKCEKYRVDLVGKTIIENYEKIR